MKPTLTRDKVAAALACSHAELSRLLREKRAPLPVKIDGAVLWYEDEVEAAKASIAKVLERRRSRK